MADWPQETVDLPSNGVICNGDGNGPVGDYLTATAGGFAAGGVMTASMVVYFPVMVRAPVTVYQMGWANGTVVSGNVDVGFYDGSSKARLVSAGSTAQAGTSALQVVDVADTVIPAGLQYLALVIDNGSGQFFRQNLTAATPVRACGAAQQASTFPLPSTATFATYAASTLPLIYAVIESAVF